MAIALNVLLLGLEVWGIRLVLQKRPLGQLFQFYTQLSNVDAALSALLGVLGRKKRNGDKQEIGLIIG